MKYIETFQNEKFNLLGISSNITFLHLYEPGELNDYNENKFIGFRYYDKGATQFDSKYFTLINSYNSKFYILEKNETMKDINDELFYDKDLDCFSVIYNNIIQKYRSKNNSIYGETFPELIGYCYGLKEINQFNNFIFIEPLIPDPFKPETLEENIPAKLEDNIAYIEPLIYNGHISLIIFMEIKGMRFNIILDMSKYHTNTSGLNKLIFPKTIIEKYLLYPNDSIQSYSSCCLWFYGQIECLLNNTYTSFKSIYDNLKNSSMQFYIDVINIIGKKYYGINDLFKEEKERCKDIKKINLNRLFINGKIKYTVDKDIMFTQFLDLNSFLNNSFFYFSQDYKVLTNNQKKLEKFIMYKNLLEINYKFYKLIESKNDVKQILVAIFDEISFIKNILLDIENNYNIEFYKKNIFSYELFLFKEIMNGNSMVFPISDEMQKKLQEVDFDSVINDNIFNLDKRKNNLEKKYTIYSEEDIMKHLNPSNEICFKVMNH